MTGAGKQDGTDGAADGGTASCAMPLLSACTVTPEAPAREAKNSLPSSKTFLTASASLTTNIAAFLPGSVRPRARMLRCGR